MRRTHTRALVAATAALTAVGGAWTAGTATAAPGQDSAAASAYAPGMLDALERDLGLGTDEAVELLQAEAHLTTTSERLTASLDESFAGSWVGDSADLTVAVTDAADVAAVEKAGAEAVVVEHSLDALDAWTAELDDALAGADGVPSYFVDVEANSIVIGVREDARAEAAALVERAGIPADAVTYEVTDAEPRPLIDVVGGNAYYIGSGSRCSVGFSVTGGFVTAGHCGSTGATTSQPSGQFRVSSFPGNDYAYVAVGSGNNLVPGVNGYDGNTYAVTGHSVAPVGSTVCRSGSTTGWHCGTIEALNATVNYSQGSVYGLIQTNVCAEPGDSGGSLLAGNSAQGMTSGGSGNCSSGGRTFFQPVGEALSAAGVSLLTY
ncbi:S1 family peptidase [Myceligenerans salitolerans]|uniref:S1 family peptidase n=1 Tax=Myceligenerans salitolerans TaxID=1230528 RepID=A0ABS3I995_9MICO|nr:S1 family peptidase [Myceligenerans salitolerans]MBO0609589.1 S1 family peptidase [Myceligenerans salitolerans]